MRKFITLSAMAALLAPALLVPTSAAEARRHYRQSEWRGNDGRTYCRKSDGTVGTIIGAAGGALVGRAIDTHGERTTGTILGAVAGGVIGNSIGSKRHCD